MQPLLCYNLLQTQLIQRPDLARDLTFPFRAMEFAHPGSLQESLTPGYLGAAVMALTQLALYYQLKTKQIVAPHRVMAWVTDN